MPAAGDTSKEQPPDGAFAEKIKPFEMSSYTGVSTPGELATEQDPAPSKKFPDSVSENVRSCGSELSESSKEVDLQKRSIVEGRSA